MVTYGKAKKLAAKKPSASNTSNTTVITKRVDCCLLR
jgi:hypothetical protein